MALCTKFGFLVSDRLFSHTHTGASIWNAHMTIEENKLRVVTRYMH
jgi:hypothetical protein